MRPLVTGATGRYGRAAALAFDAADADPVAFVLDPDAPAAHDLAERGIDVSRGRRDQLDHVEDALAETDADALFAAVGVARTTRTATERGETLVRAADRTGTPVIHASVIGADDRPGVPRVDVRGGVDAALRDRGVPHVSLRPGVPLDAFERARETVESEGRLPFPLEGHSRAPLTDPRDVGRAAVAARSAADFDGATVPVSSGEFSLYDVADVLADVAGRRVSADPRPPTDAPTSRTSFYRWVNEGAMLGAGDGLARYDLPPATLRDYFARAGWR